MTTTATSTETDWLPPTWRSGCDSDEEEGYMDSPWTVDEVVGVVKKYREQGYLTPQRHLTAKACALDPSSALYRSIVDAVHNVGALRDSWNTPGKAWALAAKLLPPGQRFVVDPMYNPGTQGLPHLSRTLDGSAPELDGYAVDESRSDDVLTNLELRGIRPTKHEGFPRLWRGDLRKGKAAAAVNGPHSATTKWLALCDAYGQEEFCAAFVPYAGDVWLWDVGYRANIVIHLGRAHCSPPPGIKESSPRGPSLVLLWVPPRWMGEAKFHRLPEITRRVLAGATVRVPYHVKSKGTYHVLVTPGCVRAEIDVGMLDVEGRA